MPIRPLRRHHRLGVDICHVPRIIRSLSKLQDATILSQSSNEWSAELNWKFVHKVLRPEELAYFRNVCRDSWVTNRKRVFHYFAGRFAAKEAIIKASPRKLTMREVIVLNDASGAPYGAILSAKQPAVSLRDYSHQHLVTDKLKLSANPGSTERLDSERSNMKPMAQSSLLSGKDSGAGIQPLHSASGIKNHPTTPGIASSTETIAYEAIIPQDELFARLDGEMVAVAISHEDEYAVATAMRLVDIRP